MIRWHVSFGIEFLSIIIWTMLFYYDCCEHCVSPWYFFFYLLFEYFNQNKSLGYSCSNKGIYVRVTQLHTHLSCLKLLSMRNYAAVPKIVFHVQWKGRMRRRDATNLSPLLRLFLLSKAGELGMQRHTRGTLNRRLDQFFDDTGGFELHPDVLPVQQDRMPFPKIELRRFNKKDVIVIGSNEASVLGQHFQQYAEYLIEN